MDGLSRYVTEAGDLSVLLHTALEWSEIYFHNSIYSWFVSLLCTLGHCAQYCTYTAMEQENMDIISILTVDKRQTDRKSVAMEKVALIKTFEGLMNELTIK